MVEQKGPVPTQVRGPSALVINPLAAETWQGYDRVMQSESGYMTRNEAAAHAGVTVRTITRWLTEGHLTKVPGRRRRRNATLIKASELDALLTTAPTNGD